VDRLPAVAQLRSLPLREETKYVLKVSYNRGAQTMVCRLAVAAGSRDCDAGLAKAQRIWRAAGLDTTGAVLVDGSGLTGNLVTADNQVQLQAVMARRPDAAAWQAALPILGVDGSLSQVQRGSAAAGKVYAKTGTLGAFDAFNGRFHLPTKALGGVMDTAHGRRFAFARLVANSLFTDLDGVLAADQAGRPTRGGILPGALTEPRDARRATHRGRPSS
jgi:D-alanyl-D-alanine carboxypeptidase/D-alanyl-D-alanine-endopeptidase (penicillin-binding protein 4)